MLVGVFLMLLVGCDFINPKDENNVPTRGQITEAVYKNEYLGFEFTKPDSWVYSTDAEIAAAMNMGAEMLGEKFQDAIKNSPSVYDMMVVDSITRSNINVGYENLAKTLSSNITVEQYIEALKSQLSSVSSMTVSFPDKYDTVKLGKNEYTRVICNAKASGIQMTQVYYLSKMDGYMGFVIVTITNGYTVADIEAMFK